MKKLRPRSVVLCFSAAALALCNAAYAQQTLPPQPIGSAATDQPQVLTRGPVHEAFAETVVFNPEPGLVVPKPPPALIEELPPDQRPDGDNVTWIPGYWGWDDSQNDFIWISGVWRSLPPGRQWIAGYWSPTGGGYVWTAGYWADAQVDEIEYLPEPPETVEVGPSIAAPSPDQCWIPGTWVWQSNRYAWRPGYWTVQQPDWEWIPAHYVWTPAGYVFVEGYWDYTVTRRGVLFAPVRLSPTVYSRPSFSYSPSAVINLNIFVDSLFIRPTYRHYYFGDYYAPGWDRNGVFAAFAFQRDRRGYDPIFTHLQWRNRNDRDWNRRIEDQYRLRRDNARERPPQTWIERTADRNRDGRPDRFESVASRFDQFTHQKDTGIGFRNLDGNERQSLNQRWRDVQTNLEQRRQVEARTQVAAAPTPKPAPIAHPPAATPLQPARVQPPPAAAPAPAPRITQTENRPVTKARLPRSPIVGKSPAQLGKAAPPSAPPQPKLDTKVTPKQYVRKTEVRQNEKKPEKQDKQDKPDKPDKPKK